MSANGNGDPLTRAAATLANYWTLRETDDDDERRRTAPACAKLLAELDWLSGEFSIEDDPELFADIDKARCEAVPSVQAERGRLFLEDLVTDDDGAAVADTLENPDARQQLAHLYHRDRPGFDAAILRLNSRGLPIKQTDALARAARETAANFEPVFAPGTRPHPQQGLGVDDLTYDDLGNARRLIRDYGRDLIFATGVGWHPYDGRRWAPDQTGAIMRAAKRVTDDLLDEAKKLPTGGEEWKAAIRFATTSGSRPRLEATVKLAETEPGAWRLPDEFDTDPFLFNVTNGTVDLRTAELRSHRREDYLTKIANAAYDPDATCPRWTRFIAEITDDHELADYLKRAIGYSLTGSTDEQCMFMPHGAGANGKTTLIETISTLLGDYATGINPSSLTTDHRRSVRSDLARLPGARFVSAVELNRGSVLDEALVKQITGQDTITVAHLYREEFDFRPQFKVWLAANHLPDVQNGGHALWRRLHVLPFPRRFPKDTTLATTLRGELPGILTWAVQGCLAWQRDGLGEPQAVRDATTGYRATQPEEATVVDYITAACHTGDPGAWTPHDDLHAAYSDWALKNGMRPMNAPTFRVRLTDLGYKPSGKRRYGNGKRAAGFYGLTPHAEDEL